MTTPIDLVIGIFLAILTAAMFTIGAVAQKKAVQDLPDIKMSDISTMTPMLKNRTWAIGTAVALLGGIPYILSQSFIGIGYTQLLLSIGLIFLAYSATKMLHEHLGWLEWTGISLILVGTVFLGLAQLSDVTVSLSDPGLLTSSLIFYVIFGIVIAVGFILYKITEWGVAKNMAIISGIFFGVGAFSSQIGTLGLEESNLIIAGVGFFLLIGGNTIATVIVNIAFQKGKAVMVIPLQSSGNYLIPVFAGITIFGQQFNNLVFFILSVILIMVGVFFLSRIQAELEESTSDETATEKITEGDE